ncbi:MAG: DUF1080 domain-containing protein [Phycisphaerales bacterium]|nr:DUF1080 domain-containing protein [Phycisphaerae bacterium]NNF44952.1 DUF1080 domain-containing protein [Phycisphaerales bacterium]NNM26685.1 DUF1080 domain-containing protein [Phycisphaerales bacterium]
MATFLRSTIFGLATVAITSSPVTADDALTPAEHAAGWTVLFDGSSTAAWRGYRRAGFPESGWIIEDGSLRVVAGGGGGDLITKQLYENFELELEWRAAPKANSGIMYRVSEEYGAPWQTGPEMQILDDEGWGVDRLDGHAAGALYDLQRPAEAKVTRPVGEFNHARIVMRDGVVKHYLNGVKVVEDDLDSADWAARVAASKFNAYEGFGRRAVGHICLQDHGDDVWFRNIRIRDLDAKRPGEIDLLAGDRLDQWTVYLKDDAPKESVFSIQDGVLVCAGRPIGYLRTHADYTNYVLTLQWRFDPVTRKGGNSGVLVRMVGADRVWPRSVEAQLQSGRAGDFWNIGEFVMATAEDRLSGRNTRHTHANERPVGDWNQYEIIVDGDRVTLVVNDEVVNEAWNVEEVPGKICLQSEGTAIHFRRVRLSEIR